MGQVGGSHHFAAGVHGELGHPDIDGTDSRFGTDDGTNGRSTGTIVTDDKFLNGQIRHAGQFTYKEARDTVGAVSLVGIGLDDNTVVQFRCMGRLMLRGIIRMDSMGLIDTQHKGFTNATRIQVGIQTTGVFAHGRRNPTHCFHHNGSTRTLSTLTPHFFVIESCQQTYIFVMGHDGFVRRMSNECFHTTKHRRKIVKTGRIQKLRTKTAHCCWLQII
mmetsp:Transcript_11105/g.18862  ORF Transcript_11105/g.18862 Transcript_11105/m.18862 type:complete len:218 (+) Transcript_11105:104-757(+)